MSQAALWKSQPYRRRAPVRAVAPARPKRAVPARAVVNRNKQGPGCGGIRVKTPLAWHNLVHDWLRSLVAIAGVSFAVVLIFMQLGFYGSVIQTATLIYSELKFDVVLRSAEYLHFSKPGFLPRTRLYQALGVEGVESTAPFYINYLPWRNPQSMQRRAFLGLAFSPE